MDTSYFSSIETWNGQSQAYGWPTALWSASESAGVSCLGDFTGVTEIQPDLLAIAENTRGK